MPQKKRRTVIFLILIGIIITSFINNTVIYAKPNSKSKDYSSYWPKCPNVLAESVCVMELSSGLVLYEKNMNKVQYPASITKIMTTMLAIENSSLGEIVTISPNAVYSVEPGGSRHDYIPGEEAAMEDVLYSVMLESANDGANAVAEHISGSIEEFAKLMTKRAKQLGCKNTNFSNANGLHSDDHYTTAYDMALISRSAMQLSAFRTITASKRYEFPATNKHDILWGNNHHQMLYANMYPQYAYTDCIGGKTGYTSMAKYTLVTFAKRGNMELVCVVMRAESPKTHPDNNEYTETTKLLDYAFENYKIYDMNDLSPINNSEESPLFTRFSSIFHKEASPLRINENSYIVLPSDTDLSKAVQKVSYYDNLQLEEGDNIIGQVSYHYAGKTVGISDIMYNVNSAINVPELESNVDIKNMISSDNTEHSGWFFISNLKPIIILIFFIIIFIIFCCFFILRLKRKKRHSYYRKHRKRHTYETFHNDYNDFK